MAWDDEEPTARCEPVTCPQCEGLGFCGLEPIVHTGNQHLGMYRLAQCDFCKGAKVVSVSQAEFWKLERAPTMPPPR